MAEFVMRDLAKKAGLEGVIDVSSAATSREELGNDVHPGTKSILDAHGIPYSSRNARQTTRDDYKNFDYIVAMDRENLRGLRRIYGEDANEKVSRLLEWVGSDRDIADPWYTGDFETAFDDVEAGCIALLNHIQHSVGYVNCRKSY